MAKKSFTKPGLSAQGEEGFYAHPLYSQLGIHDGGNHDCGCPHRHGSDRPAELAPGRENAQLHSIANN
jgi:hypothetical protein